MNVRNNKGITLMVLIIIIIVLMILTSISISNFKSELDIRNVNNLYSDIESISTKVSDYYLANDALPILEENTYLNSSEELEKLFSSKGEAEKVINPNDEGPYYVIDLHKLENLTLNYGKEYSNWTNETTSESISDIYIINKVTHQIYYPKGIKLRRKIYFTRGAISTTDVEEISAEENAEEFSREFGTIDIKFLSGTTNKITDGTAANEPVLGENMTPVKYNADTNTWDETGSDKKAWGYSYNDTSKTSKWANAVVKDDGGNITGYFVWIPRYAYKITYHSGSTEGEIIGYSDSRGIVDKDGKAVAGSQSNRRNAGDNFIVHPAFTNDVDVGGWDKEVSRNLGCKI